MKSFVSKQSKYKPNGNISDLLPVVLTCCYMMNKDEFTCVRSCSASVGILSMNRNSHHFSRKHTNSLLTLILKTGVDLISQMLFQSNI